MSPAQQAYRWGLVLMGGLFVLGAVVQYNDPDPLRWIVLYLAAAAISFAAFRKAPPPLVPALVAGLAVVWALALAPAAARTTLPQWFESWEMINQDVEQGREMGGLVVIAVWMAIVAYNSRSAD